MSFFRVASGGGREAGKGNLFPGRPLVNTATNDRVLDVHFFKTRQINLCHCFSFSLLGDSRHSRGLVGEGGIKPQEIGDGCGGRANKQWSHKLKKNLGPWFWECSGATFQKIIRITHWPAQTLGRWFDSPNWTFNEAAILLRQRVFFHLHPFQYSTEEGNYSIMSFLLTGSWSRLKKSTWIDNNDIQTNECHNKGNASLYKPEGGRRWLSLSSSHLEMSESPIQANRTHTMLLMCNTLTVASKGSFQFNTYSSAVVYVLYRETGFFWSQEPCRR